MLFSLNNRFVTSLLCISLQLCAFEARADGDLKNSTEVQDEWMPSEDYQQSFDSRVASGLFPIFVEGRLHEGLDEFRAQWKKRPSGCDFYAHHGLNNDAYDQLNAKYEKEGFKISSFTQFLSKDGTIKYQVVWNRNCQR